MAKRISIVAMDESVLCRDLMRSALAEAPDMELVGVAPSGKTGLARALQARPDVVILSVGIRDIPVEELTRTLGRELPDTGVLLSTEHEVSSRLADVVVRALGAGAFDFVIKPRQEECARPEQAADVMSRRLLPKIRSFSTALYSRMARSLAGGAGEALRGPMGGSQSRVCPHKVEGHRAEVVVIGVSTGGPEALTRLLPALPATMPVPVLIVLHMPRLFTASLAAQLDTRAALTVREAVDGCRPAAGEVHLAPGGLHLAVERTPDRALVLSIVDDPPENGCKPSVDVLFRSAALACPNGVLALLLTGMGQDGVEGLRALRKAGACILAQDEASSVVWGMPGKAVEAGLVDEVLPLDRIAGRIRKLTEGR